MNRISCVLLYVGLGFAVQAIGYGDVTFRTLASPDASVSTWAHILAWPLFLMLLCGYYMLWVLAAALVIGALVVAYMAFNDYRQRQRNLARRTQRRA